ncbi:MAG: YfhO family protein, partial [Clostridiales bacterium]|nr:YfhO family protein [Clostridiales bacterium]
MKSTHRRDRIRIVALSGILTFFILCLLFYIKGIAPFGSVSLAVMDAQIQYLDFFSYFKDVLTGKNSIAYTFGKGLGGTNIAVYSYYLSSPFSLLVVFFGAQHMNCFFNIAAALKITMASIAFATFCVHRFNANKRPVITVLLSIGYALCQYNFAQSSNIMWLDGVYMLPFILLQVYNVVRGKKNWGLSVCVGLAIVFNWYSAGIDCIFSGSWFLFELGLFVLEKKPGKKEVFRVICRYVAAMLLGVTLSAALFFP